MPSPCMLCGAECCKNHLITVTAFDVLRIAGDGYRASDFAGFAPARRINYDNEMVLEFHDTGCAEDYLLCIKSHPCYFLEWGRCSIHKIAPYVCRAYPRNSSGKMIGRMCPGIPRLMFSIFGTEIPPEYGKEIDAYRRIAAEWNRKKGKRRECLQFLMEKAGAGV
ncbi:MAG: YkgJ family cysteine cluster protein [Candidatus Micrarchaeota archaeon]